MELKWYWPAERLGLVKDLRDLSDDGTTWQVSARADEVFAWIFFVLALSLVLAVFLLRFFGARKNKDPLCRRVQRILTALILLRAILVAVGVGPYVQFYPIGGGFIDLSVLEHILSGILWALLALAVFLFGKLGHFLGVRAKNPALEKKIHKGDSF